MAKNPKLPKGGGRAAKMAAKKPSQPVQTDKFGLFLLFVIFAMLAGNVVVWDMVAAGVDGAMIFAEKRDDEAYRVSATIQAYESRKQIGQDSADQGSGAAITGAPGEVDVVLLDKGSNAGVRVGDIFKPQAALGGEVYVEFTVFEVTPTQCRAWILMGRSRAGRTELSMDHDVLKAKLPLSSEVVRQWNDQKVREALEGPRTN